MSESNNSSSLIIDQPQGLAAPLAQSQELGKIFEALSKAQAEMKPAVMDKINPHFKSRYASLSSCQNSYQGPLAKHGLSLTQQVFAVDSKHYLRTTLAHTSGQWISSTLALIVGRNDMQGLGSAITYGRRYALSGMLGLVTDEDDDGNAAVESTKSDLKFTKESKAPVAKPKPVKNHAPQSAKDFVIKDGKFKGQTIASVDQEELLAYVHSVSEALGQTGRTPPKWFQDIQGYLQQGGAA